MRPSKSFRRLKECIEGRNSKLSGCIELSPGRRPRLFHCSRGVVQPGRDPPLFNEWREWRMERSQHH
jgi:hypothetical protein